MSSVSKGITHNNPGKHNVSPATLFRLTGCQESQLRPEWNEVRRRFWAKVRVLDSDTACWEWTGSKRPLGYGQFSWSARYGRLRPAGAHRVAYELTHGVDLTGDQHIIHSCDNPSCVNPSHLRAGTRYDNMRDASAKGRLSVSRPSRQKITDAQAADIVAAALAGAKQCDLAKQYGVTTGAISQFVTGKRRPWLRLSAQRKAG
jgi:hypothetical protein